MKISLNLSGTENIEGICKLIVPKFSNEIHSWKKEVNPNFYIIRILPSS